MLGVLPAAARIPTDPEGVQWAYTETKVYDAWDYATGSRDVVVAIIDNGFDHMHPDLQENVWSNVEEVPDNGIDDDNNGYIDDVWGWNFVQGDYNKDGNIDALERKGNNRPEPDVTDLNDTQRRDETFHHATIVAGIVGAMGNNGFAGAGVNWNVSLMNVRVADNDGFGNSVLLAKALRYAVDNGAHIINVSMVGDVHGDVLSAVEYAYSRGVVIIAAAGNSSVDLNHNPVYPICADVHSGKQMVLGVSAIGEDRRLTSFSNIGSDCIDITAPGQNVASALYYAPQYGLGTAYRGGWSGTSVATPLVTGAAALIKSLQPTWGPDQIYEALLSSTHQTPSSDPAGYAHIYGAGLLQVNKAVAYAKSRMADQTSEMPTIPTEGVIDGPTSLIVADTASGRMIERSVANPTGSVKAPQVLREADAIVTFVNAFGEREFVVTKKQSATERAIIRYTDKWRIVESWTVPSTQPLRLAVGDILGTNEAEIIASPSASEKTVAWVYTLDGQLVHSVTADAPHTGVSVALVRDAGMQKSDMLAGYSKAGKLTLDRMSGEGKLLGTITIVSFGTPGPLTAADVDGNGIFEYILGAPEKQSPVVLYMTREGKVIRKFFAYDPLYHDGFSFVRAAYRGNGMEQIITVPQSNTQTIRLWENSSRFVEEWRAFGDDAKRVLQPITQY